ncbi:methyltransferase domain-containing protein [Fuerstiella marisgermanici]|uniref:Methyltransferase domain protein n=1 Tax=Fuerstiella marisgermanici TaxID=1891926 RepID=A0A1P8W949_9PLAN|nr:methyltransferase domain-containing protein [Fuerstiella marisgermanici]APZ90578.1 Methyltransferase domain protein [Fuerstiella marisgermanici]
MSVIKNVLRPAIHRMVKIGKPHFDCSICGYHGPFKDKRITRTPNLVRVDSKCLGCGAAERHRMLKLVIEELFGEGQADGKAVLHMAPEACMQPLISSKFATYHTADLFMEGVDFHEDVQDMSLASGSYDCVVISRVLTIPPDLNASIRELRRILKPDGIAIIAEIHSHQETVEFGEMRKHRSRQVGIDILNRYAEHFSRVERYDAARYGSRFQLVNRMKLDGITKDDYPVEVREQGQGFRELVAVCYA